MDFIDLEFITKMFGEAMASQNDWCENYILDIAACKLIAGQRSMFGEYFNQSVKFKSL